MPNIPDHNDPEVKVSEVKVFRQKYYIVDDDGDTGRRTDYELRESRVEVMADGDGVFLECREGAVTETLSIPTPELAVNVAKYVLNAYGNEEPEDCAEIKFLMPEVQRRISHELWRLASHITSPHGPVDAQGAKELYLHLEHIEYLLDLKMKPHPEYPAKYKPDYTKVL